MKDSRKFEELLSCWDEFCPALASELNGPPSDTITRRLKALQDAISALAPEPDVEGVPTIPDREALDGQGMHKTKKQKPGRHDKPTEPAGHYYEDGLLVPQIEEADEETLCLRDAIMRTLDTPFLPADMKPQIEKAYAIFYGHKPSEARALWEIRLEHMLQNQAYWREEDAARERHGDAPIEGSRWSSLCAEVCTPPDRPATGEQMLELLKATFADYPREWCPPGSTVAEPIDWLPPMLTAEMIERVCNQVGLSPGRPKKGEVAKRSARSVVDSLAKDLRKQR